MMTGMLASVANAHEAQIVLRSYVNIIDLKDSTRGALGAVDPQIVSDVVRLINGRCLVSAVTGDLPMVVGPIIDAISVMTRCGVDIIKVGVFGEIIAPVLTALKEQIANNPKVAIVLVFFADQPVPFQFARLSEIGIKGVMLDTADKHGGSLRTFISDADLALFVAQAKSYGLLTGLAGSLRADDVPPLLRMQPDYLGFRGALCKDNSRVQVIDNLAVQNICALFTDIVVSSEDCA